MDNILKRILDIKSQKQITDRKFASDLGLGASIVSDWKRGRSKSYFKILPEISHYLNIPLDLFKDNVAYIELHDNGNAIDKKSLEETLNNFHVKVQNQANLLEYNAKSETTFDNEEINLLQFFRKFNKTGKKKIMAYMNDICHNEQYMEDENHVR